MALDDRLSQILTAERRAGAAAERAEAALLKAGGGGGTSGGMDQRITRLEEQMIGVRDDLRDIKQAVQVLPTLPTKRDLQNFALTGIGLALAVIGIVIGGLGWLETRQTRIAPPSSSAPAIAPIVIQLPSPLPVRAPVGGGRGSKSEER